MASPLQESPYILYSDGEGNIYEDTSLYVVGRAGWDAMPIDPADWIELPEGGNLYELPGRRGIGLDVETGESIVIVGENKVGKSNFIRGLQLMHHGVELCQC